MALPTESIPASQPVAQAQPAARRQYSPSDLMAVVNELAEMLGSAKPFLITKDIRVNRDSALHLIDELRETLPVAVENADGALVEARNQLAAANQQATTLVNSAKSEADGILASAKAEAEAAKVAANAEAESIVAQTKQHARGLIEQETVVTQANARAAEIVNAAQAEAERLMTEADAYCDASLATLAAELDSLRNQIAAGRARLVERHPQLAPKPASNQPMAPAPAPAQPHQQPKSQQRHGFGASKPRR